MQSSHLGHLFTNPERRSSLLRILACTIPKDIDINICTVELLISQQLKMRKEDADIYEHLRSVAQSRRQVSQTPNFVRRSKNRAADLADIMLPLVKSQQIKYPRSLLDVGCAEGLVLLLWYFTTNNDSRSTYCEYWVRIRHAIRSGARM